MGDSVMDPATWSNNLTDGAAQIADRLADTASQLKERASEIGRSAAKKVDETRDGTAATLKSTADSVRSCGQAITEVAGKLESSANYVREHDVRGMLGDIGCAIRRNPAPAMFGALAVGFLLGSALMSGRD